MARPCDHPTGPPRTDVCHVCHLYVSNPAYRALWDVTAAAPLCLQLWKRVRDREGAVRQQTTTTACCGEKRLDLFECRHPARRGVNDENDQITLNDCVPCPYRPRPVLPNPRVLILKNHLSLGDVVCMTAALHSLHRSHPGQFLTAVETSFPAVWEHNPDAISVAEASAIGAEAVQMHYPLIDHSNERAVHVLQGYCDFLEQALRVRVPLLTNRPLLYLSRRERAWQNQVAEREKYDGPFWLVNAGAKRDGTAKQWPYYQQLVDRLRGQIAFVQVGKSEHIHQPLRGVINLLDRTDDRQLIRLVSHAQGVVCGVTALMHLAAAFDKPAVILAGGREPRSWNTYKNQQLMSTVGCLPCCGRAACWKSRTVKLDDGQPQDASLCENPVLTEPPAPRCQTIITAEEVATAILRYRT